MARQPEIPPEDLTGTVRGGDKRASLEAIRDRLAAELVRSRGQSAAAVARELRAVIDALDALPGGEVSAVADLAERLAARRAKAAGS